MSNSNVKNTFSKKDYPDVYVYWGSNGDPNNGPVKLEDGNVPIDDLINKGNFLKFQAKKGVPPNGNKHESQLTLDKSVLHHKIIVEYDSKEYIWTIKAGEPIKVADQLAVVTTDPPTNTNVEIGAKG